MPASFALSALAASLAVFPSAVETGFVSGSVISSGNLSQRFSDEKEIWQKLSREEKVEILEGVDTIRLLNARLYEFSDAEEIKNILDSEEGRIFASTFEEFAKGLYLHEEFPHSTVGNPLIASLHVLRAADGELLAFSLGAFQEGCDLPKDSVSLATEEFPTQEAALAAGCLLGDVNWSAFGVFEADGFGILVDESFEWSGY